MRIKSLKKSIQNFKFYLLATALLIAAALILLYQKGVVLQTAQNPEIPKEAQKLADSQDFKKQKELLASLLEKYGPLKTQDILKDAKLPPVLQSHFVFHLIGDYVFKKYGDNALAYCRDYYYFACAHDVVLNQIAANGTEGVKKMIANCKNTNNNDHFQCGGLVGHGFLVDQNYNLQKALTLCDSLEDLDSSFITPCYSGVFMEYVWDLHDNTAQQSDNQKADPYFPCNVVELKYKSACWKEQPTKLYPLLGENIENVVQVCNQPSIESFKKDCYYGLSRQINSLTEGSNDKATKLCMRLGPAWDDYCTIINANAAFALGSHQPALQLCTTINSDQSQKTCWETLITRIKNLKLDEDSKKELCQEISNPNYQNQCLAKIS